MEMKNYMVYAGSLHGTLTLVDNITVPSYYTVDDYREDCRLNDETAPCDYNSDVIEFVEVI